MTPGNVSFRTYSIPTDWQSVAIVNASSALGKFDGYSYISPNLVRIAIWTKSPTRPLESEYVDSSDFGDSIIEYTLSLAAWRYSNILSISNNFTIGKKEKITLEGGVISGYDNVERIWFNQSSLPRMYVLSTDIGALAKFFESPAISGGMREGESLPPHTQGITAAFINQIRQRFSLRWLKV